MQSYITLIPDFDRTGSMRIERTHFMLSFVPLMFARLVNLSSIGITSELGLDALQAQPSQVDFFVKSL